MNVSQGRGGLWVCMCWRICSWWICGKNFALKCNCSGIFFLIKIVMNSTVLLVNIKPNLTGFSAYCMLIPYCLFKELYPHKSVLQVFQKLDVHKGLEASIWLILIQTDLLSWLLSLPEKKMSFDVRQSVKSVKFKKNDRYYSSFWPQFLIILLLVMGSALYLGLFGEFWIGWNYTWVYSDWVWVLSVSSSVTFSIMSLSFSFLILVALQLVHLPTAFVQAEAIHTGIHCMNCSESFSPQLFPLVSFLTYWFVTKYLRN